MKKTKKISLVVANKQKTRQVQRYIIAGSVFSVFGFFCALMYWNLGFNTDAKAGVSYTWNGSADSLWTNSSNWTPNGVPSSVDDITIPTLARYPVLNSAINISALIMNTNSQCDLNGFNAIVDGSFTMNSGCGIQLRGKKLTLNGNATLNGGTISGNSVGAELSIQSPNTIFGNGIGGPTIDAILNVNTVRLSIRNSTFNGVSSFIKNGAGADACTGNNTFNAATTITNTSSSYILFSNSTRDIFNGPLTMNTSNVGIIYLAYNGVNTQFNENVEVNCTSTGGVRFGASNGTATVAAGKTIFVGAQGFSGGILQISKTTFEGTTDQNFQLTGTGVLNLGPATTFNGNVTSVGPGLCLNGTTFNGRFTAERNGAASNSGNGGNVFHGIAQITNSGTGYILLANSVKDIFNAELTLNSTNSGHIHIAYRGIINEFNDNVYVNSTSTGAIRLGASAGTSLVATGKNIMVGGQGFSNGTLQLSGVSFADNSNKTFNLGSDAILTLGPNIEFNGNVTTNAGGLNLSGVVFNGKLNAIKTGTSNDVGAGGNIYNDSVSIKNVGTGYLLLSNTTNDIFNSFSSFNSANSGIIYVAHRGTNTEFNGNIEVSSNSGGGVRFSTSTGSSILAAGKTITAGPEGFLGGFLMIGRVTQLGNVTQNISTGNSAIVSFGPDAVMNGKLNVTAGGVAINGGTFADDVVFVKNGSSNETGSGANTFNGNLSVTNNAIGYFLSSNSTRDVYNGTVTLSTTNSGIIYLAHKGTNTEFNNDIILKSSGTGSIRIGTSNGTSILANGKNIIADSTTYTNGLTILSRMTLPTNTQSFTFGPAATINLGPEITMNGNFNFAGGGIRFNGGTYNKPVTVVKTGTMNDDGNGANTFNDKLEATAQSSGYLLFARTNADVFQNDVTMTSNGSGFIHLAYNDSASLFNGNIILNSTSTGGIRFSAGNGVGQLASGKTVSIGSIGFNSGEVNFKKFKQIGSTPVNLNLNSGTAVLYFSTGSVFNAPVNVKFPQLGLNGATFNETTSIEKIGAGNNTSTGGNIFNAISTITNSGAGILILANNSADDFNSNVTFTQNGIGILYPAYNAACTFSSDVTVNGTAASMFLSHASLGRVVFDGSSQQQLNGVPNMAVTIRRLELNNTGSGLKLNVPLSTTNLLTMTRGNISSEVSKVLSIGTGITSVASVSDLSYVDGPVEKIGNTAFAFPTGKDGMYRPVGMTAPVSITDRFTAEYFKANPNAQYPIANKDATLNTVSRCEYWSLLRNFGTANVRAVMSWRDPVSCGITVINDLRVARWDTTASIWKDLGNGSTTGNVTAGTITSNIGAAPYVIIALASSSAANSLPVELIDFTAKKSGNVALLKWSTASEKNNDYFTVERSQNANDFMEVGRVGGYGNSTTRRDYQFTDEQPFSGTSYYRLRQTDFNGAFEVFRPAMLNFDGSMVEFKINTVGPNPFINDLLVRISSPSEMNVEVIIYNSVGNISYRQNNSLNTGSNEFEIHIDRDLPPGIYFLKVSGSDVSTEPFKLIRK